MSSTNISFFTEVKSFVNKHKILCILTLGLAVVGYSIGNLAGRAVSWIAESFGATKKTDAIARDLLHTPPKRSFKTLTDPSLSESDSVHSLDEAEDLDQITDNLLEAYNMPKQGWVIVPPKEEIKIDKPFVVGSGAIGFKGNGRWKIHVSIDPDQMEEAIPIIVDVLHGPDAPRLGFKMQTRSNLESEHQLGKELAIIFDKQVEEAALQGNPEIVENCLNLLWNKLYDAGIRPEKGNVLTPETMDEISNAPEGSQVKEKENLEAGKFDRAIPCPEDCNFFYYRDENFAPMRDDEIGDLRGTAGVYAASDIVNLAKTRPDLAHNPTQSPDPFLNLRIKAS